MARYILWHEDCDELMDVEADTPGKAKYKNFLNWSDVFNVALEPGQSKFSAYLKGLKSCKRHKAALSEGRS